MVGDMKKLHPLAMTFATSLAALALPAAAQQALPDPTRPPAGLQAAGAASAPVADAPLVLQSVLMGAGRLPAAVISGQLVPLGGAVGELRLAHIAASSVELAGSQGTTTLRLVPEGAKTRASTTTRPLRHEPQGLETTK
jgi:MSHA biogenesis protein MshK